jgi:hypothetical protein
MITGPMLQTADVVGEAVKDLLRCYLDQMQTLARSGEDDDKIKISFGVTLTPEGGGFRAVTKMSFGMRVKDEREDVVPDPDQAELFGREGRR